MLFLIIFSFVMLGSVAGVSALGKEYVRKGYSNWVLRIFELICLFLYLAAVAIFFGAIINAEWAASVLGIALAQ